jgi:molybdopterin molybdotransferase
MLNYIDALKKILEEAKEIDFESVLLHRSVGRIAHKAIYSPENYPRFTNSAIDGFACSSKVLNALNTSSSIELKIQGNIVVGEDLSDKKKFVESVCYEVMTGAMLPACYDLVLSYEEVEISKEEKKIKINKNFNKNHNVRLKGEDIKKGELILSKGVRIESEHILELATLGVQSVDVKRKPRIAIISTGSEFGARSNESEFSSKIRNSTAPWLMSFLPQINAEIIFSSEIGDSKDTYKNAFYASLTKAADIIISTGGVSLGAHDFVLNVLEEIGVEILVHRIAMRPGKPVIIGRYKKSSHDYKYIFALPGNPASTLSCSRFLIEPFIRKILGQSQEVFINAKLTCDFVKPRELQYFVPAKIEFLEDGISATPIPDPASYKVKPFTMGNGWVILDKDVEVVKKGTIVKSCFMHADSRLERAMNTTLL